MKRPLNKKDWDQLLLAPIYVSLLAVHHNGNLKKSERKGAIKLSHLRTVSSHLELRQYYRDAEINFELYLDKIDDSLPVDYEDRKVILNQKLEKLIVIADKLHQDYRKILKQSLKSFAKHMAHVNDSFLQEMTIPILMDFLNESVDHRANNLKLD